jgi:hypothetical protein
MGRADVSEFFVDDFYSTFYVRESRISYGREEDFAVFLLEYKFEVLVQAEAKVMKLFF